MYKIGVIGDRESVRGFKALGLHVEACDSPEDAAMILRKMASDGFAIIYIVEELAVQLSAQIDSYSDDLIPAVIPIPGNKGSLGFGKSQLLKSVEKAVGQSIL